MEKEQIQVLKDRYIKNLLEENFDFFINPQLIELLDGSAIVRWQPKPIHLNRFKAIHGGAIAGLIDTVAAITSLTKLKRIVTTEMNISFIKAGTIETEIEAVGKVIHSGRSLIRTEVELFNEQKQLIAKGHLTFFVLGDLVL
jgi:acyl-CoA thioesterase